MADNLKTTGKKKTADGDYENPTPAAPAATPKPLPLAPAETPSPTQLPLASTETPTVTPASYTPINANTDTSYAEHLKQKEIYGANPDTNKAYTNEELTQQLIAAGIDPSLLSDYYFKGGYTQDRDEAIANGGSGDPTQFYAPGTWYSYDGYQRPVQEGSSGADEAHMSEGEYQYIQYCKQMYAECQANGDREGMNYWHSEAEKTRARMGYSGGTDGSDYITLGYLGVNSNDGGGASGGRNSDASGGAAGAGSGSDLKSYLDAWQQAALQQSNGQIDYAVQQAITELQRALEDAQPQFKEQAETVDLSARQAMDNSALYAELRGDKGGIGQEQYNAIQNTQAQNRLAVQQAQTKLATDTERQIADLRAQGEFEKADAALEITQTYLAQLISLEQWAAEYNLSVDQFNEQIRQWEMEYNMAMQQLQISQNQWQAEFDFAQQQYQDSLALNSQNQMADVAWSLLQAGVELDADQLKALDISADQASQLLLQAQMKQSDSGDTTTKPVYDQSVYEWLYSANAKDYGTAYEELRNAGYNTTDANRYAKYYTETWLEEYTPPVDPIPDEGTWGAGYSTNQTRVPGEPLRASEWDQIKSKVRQYLENGYFAEVTAIMDQLDAAGQWNENQYNELIALLDFYGYFNKKK